MSVKVDKLVVGAAVIATGLLAGGQTAGAEIGDVETELAYAYGGQNCWALGFTESAHVSNGSWFTHLAEGRFYGSGYCDQVEAKLYIDHKNSYGIVMRTELVGTSNTLDDHEYVFGFTKGQPQHFCVRVKNNGEWSDWAVSHHHGSMNNDCDA